MVKINSSSQKMEMNVLPTSQNVASLLKLKSIVKLLAENYMSMNKRGITSALRKEGYPLELVKDETGYWYFIFDDGKKFETEEVGGVYRLGQLSDERWLEIGRASCRERV